MTRNGDLFPVRDRQAENAIVFIHGFNGHPHTWGRFPDLLSIDPELRDWDIWHFGYKSVEFHTPLTTNHTHIGEIALYLSLGLHSELSHSKRIALIASSSGGLIAQRALLDSTELLNRLSHLFLFATPSAGFAHWTRVVPLGLVPFIADTDPRGKFILKLRKDWNDRFGPDEVPFFFRTIAATEDSQIAIDSTLIPFPERYRDRAAGRHISVIQPESNQADCFKIVKKGLLSQEQQNLKTNTFDVFLSYHSPDLDEVKKISFGLRALGLVPWFDKEQLQPGRLWQTALSEEIAKAKTAAVFVGKSGIGPWQDQEQRWALEQFAQRGSSVIPVLLPDATAVPNLPESLEKFTWVDFRTNHPDPMKQLYWGITGKRLA